MESEHDRQALLRSLGEQCTVNSKSYWCVFKDGFEEVTVNDRVLSAQIITAKITTKDSDAMKARRGLALTVRGKRYTVENVEPDGTGMTVLDLSNG